MKIKKFNQPSRCPQISMCLAYGQNSWTFVFHFIFLQMLVSCRHILFWSSFLLLTFGIITELLKNEKVYYMNVFPLSGRRPLVKDLVAHT